MINCSTCGICLVDMDFKTETVKRVCKVTNKKVSITDTCGNHVPKGKVINKEVICDAHIEVAHVDTVYS